MWYINNYSGILIFFNFQGKLDFGLNKNLAKANPKELTTIDSKNCQKIK